MVEEIKTGSAIKEEFLKALKEAIDDIESGGLNEANMMQVLIVNNRSDNWGVNSYHVNMKCTDVIALSQYMSNSALKEMG